MFVQSEKFLEAHGSKRGAISVYGQEANPDTWKMRDGKPFIFTNCMTGKNIEELTDMIIRDALFDFKPAEKTA